MAVWPDWKTHASAGYKLPGRNQLVYRINYPSSLSTSYENNCENVKWLQLLVPISDFPVPQHKVI
jgi:hypothetical protein